MMRELLKKRAELTSLIRDFFVEKEFLEVDTPSLSPALIPEAPIEVFGTSYIDPYGEESEGAQELFLIPSPEVWMKRLLSEGSGSIFQLAHCFRNAESLGRIHNPEFTMLEWYEVDADYLDELEVAEELLTRLSQGSETKGLCPPVHRITVEQAFAEYAGIENLAGLDFNGLFEAGRRAGINLSASAESYEDVFHTILVDRVEPALPVDRPVALIDYPDAVPTLAQRKTGTPWAERWELYAGGVELINCYTEERNRERVQNFFETETKRKTRARVPHPPDLPLIEEMAERLPVCSGGALGFDRLLMLLSGQKSLEGVILFPLSAILNQQ
ncbi:MAG: elongation factor P--(R)-beta-lysine ligase [Spirochaetales bacterium]|nr:elongation factor P--(R)-beta-lysine ligase [Spirochaetales bacterium]MCF7937828.1 elongation factor P--(R)-beta-lysine ligase [Spirochaetales bacterium]